MNVFFIILYCVTFILLIFSLFFFLGKLKISVFVNNNKINVYLWKIKVYDSCSGENKSNRKKTIESNFENKYKKVKLSINFFRKLLDDKNDDFIYILKYINKTFNIKRIDFSLDYGFGNAAITGITGGIIWGVISNVCCIIHKYVNNIKDVLNVAVKPHYTEQIFEYNIKLVFYVRIVSLFKLLKHIKRFKNTLEGRN